VFSSLRNPNYRRYFVGQVLSLVGSWMQMIALPWLIYERTGSGTDLGVIVALQSLPILLLAPYGGVVVDRMDKRRLLTITNMIQGVLALTLGALTFTHTVQIWSIVVVALGLGLCTAFDNPGRQAIVLELVGSGELRNAVTLNSVTINVARAVGPAIAAGVIASIGVGACFMVNAASFAAVIVALRTLNVAELRPSTPQPRTRGQLRSGIGYAAKTPELRTPLLMMALIGTLSYEYQVTLAQFARHTLHGGASTYSFLTTALGLGAVICGLWVAARGKTGLLACGIATGEYAVTTALVAIAPTLPFALIALFSSGLGYIAFNTTSNSTLQLNCDPTMRGRVMALWAVMFQGSTVIGSPIAGYVGETAGPRWAIGMAAAAAACATVLAATTITSRRRNLQRDEAAQPQSMALDASAER
jgi:MFS family permease